MLRLLLIASLFALPACSTVKGWFGMEDSDDSEDDDSGKITGERIDVIADEKPLAPDESLKDQPVTLPDATAPEDWPQAGGNSTHYTPHILATLADERESASAGDGNEWMGGLMPSPVVAGPNVYAMDGNGIVSAHTRKSIDRVWESDEAESTKPAFGGGLAADRSRVYLASASGHIAALDAKDGKKIWSYELLSPVRAAPLLDGNLLFVVTVDSQLYALDAKSGTVVWTHRGINEAASLLGASVPVSAGPVIVTAYNSGELYALSRRNGNPVWNDSLLSPVRNRASDTFTGVSGDPVIAGRFVYTVSTNGILAANDLRTGLRAWEQKIASRDTPWAAGDYLFVVDINDKLYCLRRDDGRIQWVSPLLDPGEKRDEDDPLPALDGPYLVNGKLLVIDPAGSLIVADAKAGTVLERRDFPSSVLASPAFADGGLYLLDKSAKLRFLQ